MIYTGEFISKNKINYQVQFITASGNTNKEIILSEQPVTISFESEDDIFKPLKLSGATVRCWVKDYMFDLYSGEAKGVKCIVTNKEDNSVIWCGYVTPNLYSQDYLQHKFELEVECIDALAVLQYIKYNVTDRQVRSFKDIIDDAIQKTGYDLNLNVVDFCNYKLEDMYISDSNFFDEDGEPMTYKEVLENILQYLNLTMLLYADTIYILDYNLIKDDEDAIKLDESIIYSTPTLSLTEVFNKITVNSSLYNITLSPDCFNEDFIIESGDMQMYTAKSNGVYGITVFRKYTYSKDDVILKVAELSDKYWQSDQKKGTAFITGYTVVQDKNGKYKILPKSEWDTVIVAETEGNPPFEWFTVKDNKGVILPANGVININGQFQNSRYNYPTSSSDLESVYKSYKIGRAHV